MTTLTRKIRKIVTKTRESRQNGKLIFPTDEVSQKRNC